ncbi:MAG: hypothetical protein KIS76_10835 [Pyrinomonadaceae bacterium]|nr:hypothetical protein [Pyrinomonadaceae bacterium]
MKLFEGKTPEERKKIIAAIVLGVMALIALTYTFSGMFVSKKKVAVNVTASPSPTPLNAPQNPAMPSRQEMDFEYTTIPVVYNPGNFNAPDPGRNIFAFYEPGKPTPYSPTPTPPPVPIPTPTPPPPPPIFVAYSAPQSVYAGSKGFRLEISGDKFTPDSVILFNGSQLPTTYIGPQNLYAQISDSMIAFPGSRSISVITPDGKYSNLITMNVQEPPKPQLKYIGLIARARYNNDTAYFEEPGKETPIGARLNDIVGGRFRLKSISSEEVVFEDVNLGFKHKLQLNRPAPGSAAASTFSNPRNPTTPNYNTVNPNNPNYNPVNPYVNPPSGSIPGIPDDIKRYVPTPRPNTDPNIDPASVDSDDGNDGKP